MSLFEAPAFACTQAQAPEQNPGCILNCGFQLQRNLQEWLISQQDMAKARGQSWPARPVIRSTA
jgi:hypothetical protein